LAWEIERRFLVRVEERVWSEAGPGRHLHQGYLVAGDPSVRVRTGEERGAVLTCKSGKGIRRTEEESVIPDALATMLLAASGAHTLEKVRFQIGPWELDRFLGPLEGLSILEIELETEGDALPEPPRGVDISREVTGDKHFTNAHLARASSRQRRAFVRRVYKEEPSWTRHER
jgi:CYTH domain-containing protein